MTLIQGREAYQKKKSKKSRKSKKAMAGSLSRLFLVLKVWKMPMLFEGAHRPLKGARRKRKRGRAR